MYNVKLVFKLKAVTQLLQSTAGRLGADARARLEGGLWRGRAARRTPRHQERAPPAGLPPAAVPTQLPGGKEGTRWVIRVADIAHPGGREFFLELLHPRPAGRPLSPHHTDSQRGVRIGRGEGFFSLTWTRDGKGGVVISFRFIWGTPGPSLRGTRFQVLNFFLSRAGRAA